MYSLTTTHTSVEKNSNFWSWGGSSRTRRKLTRHLGSIPLPERITANVDTFQILAYGNIAKPTIPDEIRWVNDYIALEYTNSRGSAFEYKWNLHYYGEHVAQILTHPTNPNALESNVCKLELQNHLLYSSEWITIYNFLMDSLSFQFKNITRLDIALDGVNHLYYFMNWYVKQTAGRKTIEMKGRANVDPKRLDKKTMLYQNFRIGSAGKYFTLYNKSKEIDERSHKEYIRNLWEKNFFDLSMPVWRCELRMGSQAVQRIKGIHHEAVDQEGELIEDMSQDYYTEGLDINQLANPQYLLQIFRTQTKNFFEFVELTDTNISRCPVIDLFGFNIRNVTILDKIPRQVVRGAYKAKMAIHNAVANVLLRHIDDAEDIVAAFRHIKTNINLYNLDRYFLRKLPRWNEQYQPVQYTDTHRKHRRMLEEILY